MGRSDRAVRGPGNFALFRRRIQCFGHSRRQKWPAAHQRLGIHSANSNRPRRNFCLLLALRPHTICEVIRCGEVAERLKAGLHRKDRGGHDLHRTENDGHDGSGARCIVRLRGATMTEGKISGTGSGASLRQEARVWGRFVFWGACMSDINVQPPRGKEAAVGLIGGGWGGGSRMRNGFAY